MGNKLTRLLEQRDWLLLDGATGTTLFSMGLEAGEAPELWNLDYPERIRDLHAGFVENGSDVILTNSFGGSRFRLKLHGLEDRVYDINKRASELAREVAEASRREVVVAGSIGPSGELMQPLGALSYEEAVTAFEEQARGLLDGGVDVLWAETISAPEELAAIAQAAHNLGAELCATLSFDSAGRTMMGVTSKAYGQLADTLAAKPFAIGANCGVGASDLVRTVLGLSEAAPEALIIAKANAGIPKYVDGHICYDGTPELMGRYACLVRDAGARLIGGCCGTTGAHLRAMRAALENHVSIERPSLDRVQAELGVFSSEDDGTNEAQTPKRTNRRKRLRQEA